MEGLSSAGVFRAAKSQRGRVWGSQNLRRCLSASPNLLTRWQLGWMSRYPLVCFVFFFLLCPVLPVEANFLTLW